ncbi:malonyl-ACP O-methyltransferase BioC [bacterium]|nr:malonyl-ACP O-methyltransferase BioC [bacterium]
MTKELIKKRFSKSLYTYDENALAQKEMSKKLVSMVKHKEPISVLEIGCGTGFVTKEVFNNYEISKYDAVDLVQGCEKFLSDISSKINFYCADIENYTPQQKYDLIISNASMQWLDNLQKYIDNTMKYLKPNGIFAFTIFGDGNYKEMEQFIPKPLTYYSIDKIKDICKKYNIEKITQETIKIEFKTPRDILHHIQNTGVNALNETRWTKSDLTNFENNYPKENNTYQLTYNPIYVLIQNK